MKRLLLPAMIAMALLVPAIPASAAPKAKNSPGVVDPSPGMAAPGSPVSKANEPQSVFEYQGDELPLVIRTLARQASMNVVVDAEIRGPVTLRVENKTPRQVLETVVKMNDLVMERKWDVYFLRNRHPKPVVAAATAKSNDLTPTDLETFVPLMTKFLDILLDYEARPQTAQKIAQSKKALQEALVAQGLTREEAFKLLLAEPGLSFFGMRR